MGEDVGTVVLGSAVVEHPVALVGETSPGVEGAGHTGGSVASELAFVEMQIGAELGMAEEPIAAA